MRITRMLVLCFAVTACGARDSVRPPAAAGPFDSDLSFLREHTDVVVLSDAAGRSRVIVAPEYQGRVLTSTTGGDIAPSFGWIGRTAIAARARQPHMTVFGGEDRFWLGPEGGQYALYFKAGDPFDLAHWQVPEPIDWGSWDIVSQSTSSVQFRKRMSLINYSGAQFEVEVERTVRMLNTDAFQQFPQHQRTTIGEGVQMVAFESSNTLTNAGKTAWTPKGGLVSIWILGMFVPSPKTTIVIPYVPGRVSESGPFVNDKYFGPVPPDRLRVRDDVVLFKGDGQYRSKIGLSPLRAFPVFGSYDAAAHMLTLVHYTKGSDGVADYVNSMWEMQKEPYKGDVINSYNDGPPEPGKSPLGPFYELETSSPALNLEPGQSYTHVHRTFHLVGPEAELDRLSRAVLKVSMKDLSF
jgi:hypothetical protein